MHRFFILIIPFFLFACKAKKISKQPVQTDRDVVVSQQDEVYKKLVVESLQVLNMEEDNGLFSTKNDEILLFYAAKAENRKYNVVLSDEMVFDSIGHTHDFFQNLVIEDLAQEKLVFHLVLIEIDEDWTSAKTEMLQDRLDRFIKKPVQSEEELKTILDTNDLLAYELVPIGKIPKSGYTMQLEGKHFLDKYHYVLKIKLQ